MYAIQVNEQRVEGATHAQVVSLIRQGGESLSLTVSIYAYNCSIYNLYVF